VHIATVSFQVAYDLNQILKLNHNPNLDQLWLGQNHLEVFLSILLTLLFSLTLARSIGHVHFQGQTWEKKTVHIQKSSTKFISLFCLALNQTLAILKI
jgi:hypothetical protein